MLSVLPVKIPQEIVYSDVMKAVPNAMVKMNVLQLNQDFM